MYTRSQTPRAQEDRYEDVHETVYGLVCKRAATLLGFADCVTDVVAGLVLKAVGPSASEAEVRAATEHVLRDLSCIIDDGDVAKAVDTFRRDIDLALKKWLENVTRN